MIASPEQGGAVGCEKQSVHFITNEKADNSAVVPFARYHQDALYAPGVLRMPQGRVPEERSNRGESSIVCAGAVVSTLLQMAEERSPPASG